jgi:hypothetical protein
LKNRFIALFPSIIFSATIMQQIQYIFCKIHYPFQTQGSDTQEIVAPVVPAVASPAKSIERSWGTQESILISPTER